MPRRRQTKPAHPTHSYTFLLSIIGSLTTAMLALLYSKLGANNQTSSVNIPLQAFPTNRLNQNELTLYREKALPSVHIDLAPELKRFSDKVGKEHFFVARVIAFKEVIRQALKEAVTTRLMRDVVTNSSLSIWVGVPGAFTFSGKENAIRIGWELGLNAKDCVMPLRNEMHHAMVRYRNHLHGKTKSSDDMLLSEPVLNLDGGVDKRQADRLIKAVQAGYDRVLKLKRLIIAKAQGIELAPRDQVFLSQAIHALQAAKIRESVVAISKQEFDATIKPFIVPTGNKAIQYYLPPERMAVSFKPLTGIYYHHIKPDDGKLVMRYGFTKGDDIDGKLRGFVTLWELTHLKYSSAKLPAWRLAAELASSMEDFSEPVQSLFFPEFCQFFSEFHRVSDYCALVL